MIATQVQAERRSFDCKRRVEYGTELWDDNRKRARVYNNNNPQPVLGDQTRITIPQGWKDCPRFGQNIGCIIPSKVPLSESYSDALHPDNIYTFKQWLANNNTRKLGLVIDLTNTTRYYHPSRELSQEGIEHVKIPCSGRDAVPDNSSVNTFVSQVYQFEKHNRSNKYVLVHCTHGHNRTGFMIVHYLMRSRPMMTVTLALKTFSDARPPGIYKPDYIDALYTFYQEVKPGSYICPPTHEWKRLDLHDDDILGDDIPSDQEVEYQKFCYEMLNIDSTSGGSMYFPGSHPVSLGREQLRLLRHRYYYATWKADGTRYMMLLTKEGCYLINRAFRFRKVHMRFPRSDYHEVHHKTLLDGEMVVDTLPDGRQVRRYLVYDLVAINGKSVTELPFCERWNIIEREVIKPRNDERKLTNHWYKYELEPFGVRIKVFCLLSALDKVFKELIPSLSHEADGIIFQCWDDPYKPRANNYLLKWKYPEKNSVDFLVEMTKDGHRRLFLHERGRKKLMEGYSVEFSGDCWKNPASYSGKIVECSWDREKKVWLGMRIRVDKDTPNDTIAAFRVIKSINDNITEEVLLDEIKEIIRLPMYAERIHMDTQAAKRGKHANRKAL
ncbi:PREDICTED: mRNA-capping enzyme-like [Camelina sativa]|uniref:mRNA guanylyltransferase n=1 Tax=Camelina sativa TaxID=90675 RepID=A0ABM0XSY0_CAMSA|nr:PREDICTED: mRNA-capping enzyme-like [Camelina sativa]